MSTVPTGVGDGLGDGRGDGRGDHGLQAERTSLAWSRTLIGLVAVMALCVRTTGHQQWQVPLSVALYAAVIGFVALRQTIRYRRALSGTGSSSSSASVVDVIVLAGVTVVLALQALQALWWVATPTG